MFNSRFFSNKFLKNLLHDLKYLLNVLWTWVCKLLLLLGDYFSNEFWNILVLISWPFCLEFKYSLFQILLDILARHSSGKFQGLHIFSSTNHYVTFISNFVLYFPWFTIVDIYTLLTNILMRNFKREQAMCRLASNHNNNSKSEKLISKSRNLDITQKMSGCWYFYQKLPT